MRASRAAAATLTDCQEGIAMATIIDRMPTTTSNSTKENALVDTDLNFTDLSRVTRHPSTPLAIQSITRGSLTYIILHGQITDHSGCAVVLYAVLVPLFGRSIRVVRDSSLACLRACTTSIGAYAASLIAAP